MTNSKKPFVKFKDLIKILCFFVGGQLLIVLLIVIPTIPTHSIAKYESIYESFNGDKGYLPTEIPDNVSEVEFSASIKSGFVASYIYLKFKASDEYIDNYIKAHKEGEPVKLSETSSEMKLPKSLKKIREKEENADRIYVYTHYSEKNNVMNFSVDEENDIIYFYSVYSTR